MPDKDPALEAALRAIAARWESTEDASERDDMDVAFRRIENQLYNAKPGARSKKDACAALVSALIHKAGSAGIEPVWQMFKRGKASKPAKLDSPVGTFDLYVERNEKQQFVAIAELDGKPVLRRIRASLKNAIK